MTPTVIPQRNILQERQMPETFTRVHSVVVEGERVETLEVAEVLELRDVVASQVEVGHQRQQLTVVQPSQTTAAQL